MKQRVEFIILEENEHEHSISFAVVDPSNRAKCLILQRMPAVEQGEFENKKGVKVFLEGDHFDQEYDNYLININISDEEIGIRASYREYRLDISSVDKTEIKNMKELLRKQNHDKKFTVHFM